MVTRVTGHLRLDKRYYKELSLRGNNLRHSVGVVNT